jgi:fatty-acyl-CoA synthase
LNQLKISNFVDIQEFEKVPINERLSFFNTYDMLKNGAAIDPDALAISFISSAEDYTSPQLVTYRQFMAQINQTANLLHDMNIGSQDVVSYLLPNLPQTHSILWGGEAVGIVNPINPMLESATITKLCQAAGTKVLVALGEIPGADIWEKALAVRKDLPEIKAIIRVLGPSDEKKGIYGFDETLAKYNNEKLNFRREIQPADIASLYHTGGTTGTPKLAPHSHYNEVAMAFMLRCAITLNQGETSLCGLPLFHVNGTMVTGAMPFSVGGHVVLLTPSGYRNPDIIKNFYKIVEHYKANNFSAVPTVIAMLTDVPTRGMDISSLRSVICGAAPLSVELFNKFESHTNMKIQEGYGLTEGTTASSINPFHGKRKVGSIGLRFPYQDMRIFNVDDQGQFVREAEVDEIGSVCIKGPNVFKGYTEERYNTEIWPKEGWFNTGDLGRRDADGYVWLTGRKKELIIRGGHNIDPATIENPLYNLEGVSLAAAVGRPDPRLGEMPVVYVQCKEDSDLTPETIKAYLETQIGERAAVPKEVLIIEEMPLTPVGKIFKPKLQWDAMRRALQFELDKLEKTFEVKEISVGEDPLHGTLATVMLKTSTGATSEEIESQIKNLLAEYSIKYRLEFIE